MEERRRRNGDVDLALYTKVKQMLAGEHQVLPYPSDGHHIAVVFDQQATPDAAERLIAELELPVLRVATPSGEIWLWVNIPQTTTEGDVRSVLEAVVTSGSAGIGEPTSGRGSLAATHRQAKLACRLGTLQQARVSSYADVALEALAFGGQDAARDFTRAELGLLADDGERAEMLRRTVQTYFASGGSAVAAAAELGVAERTVTYRLRRAEELVGRPLSARRAEIEAALRLHRVLDHVA
jgi:DNA-binding PucR family transcriptional regulator